MAWCIGWCIGEGAIEIIETHTRAQAPVVELAHAPLCELLAGVVDFEEFVVAVVAAVVAGLWPQVVFPVEQRPGENGRRGEGDEGDAGGSDEGRDEEEENAELRPGHGDYLRDLARCCKQRFFFYGRERKETGKRR